MHTLLEARNITKDFGQKKGVFGLELTLHPGEIVGFIGPNGAGKSTTIGMLCGNIYPDSGGVRIFGKPIKPTTIYKHMSHIGILLSEPTTENNLTPKQAFVEAEQLYGRTTSWEALSQKLNLDIHKTISKLSLGNKKKVGIILALMHEPDLIIMDEPTSGIDPLIAGKFGTLLREASARGSAVLLSSHDLNEIQDVCDRVIMIKDGHILIDKPINDLLKTANRKISVNNPDQKLRAALAKLQKDNCTETSAGLILQTQHYAQVIELLVKHGHYDFLVENPSLEEMFAEYYK